MTGPVPKLIRADCAKADRSLVEITPSWYVDAGTAPSPMIAAAVPEFKRFLAEGFGIQLGTRKRGRTPITVRVNPARREQGLRHKREHWISVAPDQLTITGGEEWGVACGLYHLQRLMQIQRRPGLPAGMIHARPTLEPSLTCLAFKRSTNNNMDYPTAYHPRYLARIARAGYSGFHLDLALDLFFHSKILPELNHPRYEENIAILEKVVERSRRCALEVYLTPYLNLLREDHPVFRNNPELKGSRCLFSSTETGGLHVLCSGQKKTRSFYEEQAAMLFRRVPGLSGLFLITGCEGFIHCYTVPNSRSRNQTDCPTCGRKDPEKTVAALVGGVARAVKAVKRDALVAVWPYGASTWAKTTDAHQHVSLLPRDCAYMGNFDTGEFGEREGVRFMHYDYSLSLVGPSATFSRQTREALARGLKVMAKVESGVPLEMLSVPCIPANTRWARKYRNVLASGATGAMFAWEFGGYQEEAPWELPGWMSWTPCPAPEEMLRRIAIRDFGEGNAKTVLMGWRCFDKAMDHFCPFSSAAGTWRGPFYIGFAQPLIFDPSIPGKLSPRFWLGKPGAPDSKPLFVSNLLWAFPFGEDACLRSLRKMEKLWAKGCSLLDLAKMSAKADPYAAEKLEKEKALGRGILCMIRTAVNMVRFFSVRDRYLTEASGLRVARQRLTELREIAKAELNNTEEGLQCLQRHIMLGHDYINMGGFTAEMVLSKIAHTKELIERVIPTRMFEHSFMMQSRDEWIRDDGSKWR